jgi:hypothetical protein
MGDISSTIRGFRAILTIFLLQIAASLTKKPSLGHLQTLRRPTVWRATAREA